MSLHNPTFFGRYVGYLTDHPSCLILLNYSNILTNIDMRRGGVEVVEVVEEMEVVCPALRRGAE